MSAVVCGKRSNSIFDELQHTSPPVSKRIRCSTGASSPRFSPPRASSHSPSFDIAYSGNSPLARLRSLFPDMDPELLGRALEAAGNDLDSAIRSLNDLHLEPAEMAIGFASSKSENETEATVNLQTEAILNTNGGDAPSEVQSTTCILPKDGSEWVDLFVREMMSAADVDDARSRASQVLEVLEKSIVTRAGAEATLSFQKESIMLKEQVQVLLRENSVLKRAVAIQHERQKEYDERSQEMQHLKQLVLQYQEQLRTLEVNNYALMMHLRQAQQSNSIPGHFHPDVF